MASCFICHKSNQTGYRVSHSAIKTKRIFKPNLHILRVRIQNDPMIKKVRICAKCYKKTKTDFWGGKNPKLVPLSLLNQQERKEKVKSAASANNQ
jgi:large subunit ribosomal protein L28